jgi:Holliday junction resolvase RusA-like endonuclease
MDRMIHFHVPGNPLPKQSYRHSKHGGYTPKRIKDWQQAVSVTAMFAMFDLSLETQQGDLACELVFVRGDRRKVDLDNLSKAVLDAMNGIVYEDDKQIVDLRLRKFYSKESPGLTVKVYPVEGGSEDG